MYLLRSGRAFVIIKKIEKQEGKVLKKINISKEEIATFFKNNGRTIAKKTGLTLLVLFMITAICLSIYSIAAYSNLRITVDLADEKQTVQGFGASMAWTFQRMGEEGTDEVKERSVEMLYGDSGLRLNIARFNIGGGSADSNLDNVVPYCNDWFDPDRRAESFFMAENYLDASDEELFAAFADESNYDFTRDAGALEMLDMALATGNIDRIVFFANSPHYLMTYSGTCTGAEVQQNNLKEEFYGAYCDYLLIIVDNLVEKHFTGLENMPEVVISPVNEPQWDWGGDGSSQEGCHFDPEPLAAFYDVFFDKLEAFNTANGTSYECDVLESGNYKFYIDRKDIKEYLKAMSKYDYFDEIDSVSAHSYGADDSKTHRQKYQDYIDKNYPGLGISITEYCEMEGGRFDTIESGLLLGNVISRDLTMLSATDWSWWLAVSPCDYNDGLVYWDVLDDGTQKLSVLKRYYVMGQFSRYIEKGDVRVGATCSDLTGWAGLDYSAYKRADGTVVVVIINNSKSFKNVTVGGLSDYTKAVEVRTTSEAQTGWDEKETAWTGKVSLPAQSVTTYVLTK